MPLSQLYDIFRAFPRQTEKIDTHQYIRREDRKQRRKQQDKNKKSEESLFGEDNATVSVTALQAFFYDLIEQQDDSPDIKEEYDEKDHPSRPGHPSTLAVNAYQHAAETDPGYKTNENIKKIKPSENKIALPAKDKERIKALLVSLQILSKKNVDLITLEPAPDFLRSIETAIKKYL